MAVTSSTSKQMTSRRRGVALLLVLAMIILIVPVAVGFAQRAVLANLEDRLSTQEQVAGSVRAQLEAGPLQSWLAGESAKVVLDLDARTPRIESLNERWRLDGIVYEVRMTAWDQCGMAPAAMLATASPLRGALPGGILERFDQANAVKEQREPAGLDQFGAGFDPLAGDRSALRSVFPAPDETDVLSIGAWIATHPVGDSGSINVNTAPLPLIETAMSLAGRGGIEAIIAARWEGRRAPLPAAIEMDSQVAQPNLAPRLVGVSNSWAMRIDVRVGSIQRSWWSVYRQSSGRWECVQRLVIPD